MTRAELKTELFRRLNESEVDPTFWTEGDVEDALNEAYMEVSDATDWYERSFLVDLLASRPYYDLRTVLPRTALALGPAFNTQTNRWLIPTAVSDFDGSDRRWERVVGEPERLLLRGLWWLGYWPRVQGDSGTVQQYYSALPDPLETDTDVPGFPEQFHLALVELALSEMLVEMGDVDAALEAWAAYVTFERGVTLWAQARARVPMVRGFGGNTRLPAR